MKYVLALLCYITTLSYTSTPELHTKTTEIVLKTTLENLQKHTKFVLESTHNRSISKNLDTKINLFATEYTCLITAYTQLDTQKLALYCENCLCYAQELAEEFKLNSAEHYYTGHAHIHNAINCLKTIKHHLRYIALTKK